MSERDEYRRLWGSSTPSRYLEQPPLPRCPANGFNCDRGCKEPCEPAPGVMGTYTDQPKGGA